MSENPECYEEVSGPLSAAKPKIRRDEKKDSREHVDHRLDANGMTLNMRRENPSGRHQQWIPASQ